MRANFSGRVFGVRVQGSRIPRNHAELAAGWPKVGRVAQSSRNGPSVPRYDRGALLTVGYIRSPGKVSYCIDVFLLGRDCHVERRRVAPGLGATDNLQGSSQLQTRRLPSYL